MTPWITLVAVLALFTIVYALGRALTRMRRRERVDCPVRGRQFEIETFWKPDRRFNYSRRVDVASCSAFDDPDHIECGKECLQVPFIFRPHPSELAESRDHVH
jgi:hypothetical protein